MTRNYIADLIIAEARKWIEVREQGYNKGKEVEMFQKAVDGKAQGESWCMAFVQFCVLQVAKQLDLSEENLRKTFYPTEHCLTLWNKTQAKYKSQLCSTGMIAIWQHGDTTSGHTGFTIDKPFYEASGEYFKTIEGNTNKAGSREGDGVYNKTRSLKSSETFKLRGFIDLPSMIFDLVPIEKEIA